MTDAILAHNCDIFLSKLAEWQSANDGDPVPRTVTEWRNATGLSDDELSAVQLHLRRTWRIEVVAVHAWWSYSLGDEQ